MNRSGSGHPYVRVGTGKVPGDLSTVARLIVQPGRGTIVKYRDGNPLNLQRANLYVTGGNAMGREALALAEPSAEF